jgi:uroporphyrinogen-III decarboxylase
MTSTMSPRERLLAAFHRRPCDSVPFTPLLEGYFQAGLADRKEQNGADLQYDMAGHILLRVHVIRPNTPLWLGASPVDLPPGVEQTLHGDNGDIILGVNTPVGSLTWRLRFAPESPFIPWVIENHIKTVEDIKTFHYLIEHTKFDMSLEFFEKMEEYVGDRGIVTVLGPCSPLEQMINFDIGLEQVIYLLADYPDEMNEMLEAFHAKQVEAWKLMAEAPAEIFFIHDNLSSTTISRPMYRRHDRRYVNDYADVLHAAGKKLITHWCGRLTAFGEDFGEARHDGISDVTPLPTGDADIPAARKTWAKNFVVMGGIDPTLFARGTVADMEAYVEDLLTRLEPDRRGFILGSGDAVPFGTPPENVRAATAVAARFPVE